MRRVRVGRLGDDSGQGLIEYAVILALASLGIMLALALLRDSIANTVQVAGNHIDAAGSVTGYQSGTGGSAGGGTSGGAGGGGGYGGGGYGGGGYDGKGRYGGGNGQGNSGNGYGNNGGRGK